MRLRPRNIKAPHVHLHPVPHGASTPVRTTQAGNPLRAAVVLGGRRGGAPERSGFRALKDRSDAMEETRPALAPPSSPAPPADTSPRPPSRLRDIEKVAGVFFRALGGDPACAWRRQPPTSTAPGAACCSASPAPTSAWPRRAWTYPRCACRPRSTPSPRRSLNRDLYLWLARSPPAMARRPEADAATDAGRHSAGARWRTRRAAPGSCARTRPPPCAPSRAGPASRPATAAWSTPRSPNGPGSKAAALPQRPSERLIRQALHRPRQRRCPFPLPPRQATQPVLLWLSNPAWRHGGSTGMGSGGVGEAGGSRPAGQQPPGPPRRAPGRRAREARHDHPFRAESLRRWRSSSRSSAAPTTRPDDNAADAAANLDHLSITRDGERVASKVRFDLDLPSAAEGRRRARRRHPAAGVGLKNLLLEGPRPPRRVTPSLHDPRAAPCPCPSTCAAPPRRFASSPRLSPRAALAQAQVDGSELDLDAVVRAATDRAIGHHPPTSSTCRWKASATSPAWRSPTRRCRPTPGSRLKPARDRRHPRLAAAVRRGPVATGDRFALCGFLGQAQQRALPPPRDFDQRFDDRARPHHGDQAGLLRPPGAAIRHATRSSTPGRRRAPHPADPVRRQAPTTSTCTTAATWHRGHPRRRNGRGAQPRRGSVLRHHRPRARATFRPICSVRLATR